MTTPAIRAGLEISVRAISDLFIDRQINRLPLVDADRHCYPHRPSPCLPPLPLRSAAMKYFKKMRGNGQSPPRVSPAEVCWSWIGSFLGIAAVALVVNNIPKTRKYPEFWW